MPIRRLAFALCATLFLAGCMTQRDSADMDDVPSDDDMMANDTTEADTATTRGGGMPNIPVYLYGTWDFTATQIDGADTMAGVLTIAEEEGGSRLVASNGIDAPLVIEGMEVTNANFTLAATVHTDAGPVPVDLAGSLTGDEMTAEAEIEGSGTYALTGTRRGK